MRPGAREAVAHALRVRAAAVRRGAGDFAATAAARFTGSLLALLWLRALVALLRATVGLRAFLPLLRATILLAARRVG